MQFFLFDFQLQHNGVQLHVQVVGSLQLPFIVLPDVQGMPEGKRRTFLYICHRCARRLGLVLIVNGGA